MTAARTDEATPSPLGLRVLAEIPAYLSERIAQHRATAADVVAAELAERVVDELNNGQRYLLAAERVAELVDRYDRAAARRVEERAATPEPAAPERRAALRRPRRAVGVPRELDTAQQERARQAADRMRATIRDAAEREAAGIVVTLTRELLDSPIAVGDGTTVRIGDATADQLDARIDMLTAQAGGTVETIARLTAMRNMLRAAGAATLREVAR